MIEDVFNVSKGRNSIDVVYSCLITMKYILLVCV